MQHEATKSEFKAKALELFRQVESSGEVLVITDRGHPTIEVRRFRSDKRTPLEKLRGSIVEYHDPEEPIASDDWELLS
ncbi:MAG: type II toxin-antitoxin system Phd/YefM family antitoxin [Marinobacterium sp.]